MSDDFIRLVSQANPAARYQPANNGYPPHTSSDQQLDPFFDDDDDDDVPDSAFGASHAMKSQESGLPLSRAGAPPAGHSQVTLATAAIPPDWSFDDDEPSKQPRAPGLNTHAARPTHKRRSSRSFVGRVKKLRWPWQKGDKVLAGNRVIALNNPDANTDYCSNYVSTSKYNVVSFVPKFFFGAFPHILLRAVRLNLPQSSSRNMPIYSSSSPRSFSRYPMCPPRTAGRRSHRSP